MAEKTMRGDLAERIRTALAGAPSDAVRLDVLQRVLRDFKAATLADLRLREVETFLNGVAEAVVDLDVANADAAKRIGELLT